MTPRDTDKEYILNTYKRFDIVLTHGKGSYVYDENGERYTDLTSGIGVNSFGLCDDLWSDAVKKQADTLTHMSNLFYTLPCIELSEKICRKTSMSKVFFSNSGAEANECAVKAARKYSKDKGYERYNILTLKDSFHGRTVTTLSATGQDHYHKDFQPLTEGFIYAKANDINDFYVKAEMNALCAVMIEIIQGEGGVNVLKKEYVKKIRKYCDENDILLIIDEVQTGNGRTGRLYSYMHYDIQPDIFTTAKGLGGGLPIGACVFSKKTENVMGFGDHGSTFGGNPLCCAGAITIFDRLTDAFLLEVEKKGDLIKQILKDCKNITNIDGMGLMIGIKTTKDTASIVKKCIENKILVLTAKDKIRLLPPLNIENDVLKKAVIILKDIIDEE